MYSIENKQLNAHPTIHFQDDNVIKVVDEHIDTLLESETVCILYIV